MVTESVCNGCGPGGLILVKGCGTLSKHVSRLSETEDLVCLGIVLSGVSGFLAYVRCNLFYRRSHHGEGDGTTTAQAVHRFSLGYTKCGKMSVKPSGDL